jgi:GTP-binding protein HflX
LARVEGQREQGRRARRRAEIPTVSLVGYTNAGKSTLFNRLTEAGVYAQDQLFATLDPTLRRVELPDNTHVILADTVGFVSNLPHELVAAFKSTLQETAEATLLLHVIDAASHRRTEQIHDVETVLEQIGADEVPMIQVFNKIDLMDDTGPRVERDEEGQISRVWLSAVNGAGVDDLLMALSEYFKAASVRQIIRLKPSDGRLRALLFERGVVHHERHTDDGDWELDVELSRRDFDQLLSHEPKLRHAVVN